MAAVLAVTLSALGLFAAVPATAAPVGPGSPNEHHFAPVCAAPLPGYAACQSVVDLGVFGPLTTNAATPQGYGPSDLQLAYGLPSATAGSGHTVAIVVAYDLPTAQSDLNTYRAQFGLPACGPGCFTKVNQNGGSTLPAADAGWGQETALDMDMVSAACPNCKILVVEAASAKLSDLGAAVNTAVRLGAVAVSNSYGGPESANDITYDNDFYNHPGVAITASSGDTGYGVSYPAASQYVTAVGGTSLYRAGNSRGFLESAWSGSGSGCSAFSPKPLWQRDTGCSRRTVADVAAVADPATGVATYDSTPNGNQSGWLVAGGTSVSAPLVAAVYALSVSPPASSTPAAFPYSSASTLFDVVSGSNGSCGTYLCNANVGYDGPTGLGTPHGVDAFTTPSSSSTSYVTTGPTRVADTRSAAGARSISGPGDAYPVGPLAADTTYKLDFAKAGIKLGQAAYVFNVTAIGPTGLGNLNVAPGTSPAAAPSTSLINYQPGKDVANLVIVPNLPGSGVDTLQLYSAAASANVAVDLVGYYPVAAVPTITPVTPSRIADTRQTGGGGAVAAGGTRSFQVAGSGGLPARGAKAVALNVTAVNPGGWGNLRIFADGAAVPTTSNINYIPGQDKSAFVIVNLPDDGKINVYSDGSAADVLIDAYASYDQTGSNIVTATPTRVFDSRPSGTLPAGGSTNVQVAGKAGVPANAQAALVSVTGIHTTGSTGSGNLRVYPTGPVVPNVSNLNYVGPTADVANFAVVALSASGQITVNTQGSPTDVTVDVLGYIPVS